MAKAALTDLLTEREQQIMLQTVGLDRSPNSYRNAFICRMDSPMVISANNLMADGYLSRDAYPLKANCWFFKATPTGLDAARQVFAAKQGVKHG